MLPLPSPVLIALLAALFATAANAQCRTPCGPDGLWKCFAGGVCCQYQAFVCLAITGFNPIRTGGPTCCRDGVCASLTGFKQGCCPYKRTCDGVGDTYCCDDGQECYINMPSGRNHCISSPGAGTAAAAGGPPPSPPNFGTYGGYTAAGKPITYPAMTHLSGQAGAWGMGAAGGVYPQPPGAYPNPEAPGGTGPGAGSPVDRNGATAAGRLLAIIGLSVSPQPKAILAGAPGSITVTASGAAGTYIRRVVFMVMGATVGEASGGGPSFSLTFNIGALNLRRNSLLRAVAYGPQGSKLSFATMQIPVVVIPTWVTLLYGTFPGSAASWSKFWELEVSWGEGGQSQGLDNDMVPIKITVESFFKAGLEVSSSAGTFSIGGSGGWRVVAETPKGDSSAELNLQMTAASKIQPGSGGAYTVGMDSMTIAGNAEAVIPIPQLTWKFEFWIIAEAKIQVSVKIGIGFSVILPGSPNRQLFGFPVYVSTITFNFLVGIVLNLGAGIAGISGECEASATMSGSITYTPPHEFHMPGPSLTLEFKCKGCIDYWIGEACMTVTIFKITCSIQSGCSSRKRSIRDGTSPAVPRIVPYAQLPEFRTWTRQSLVITGVSAVPSLAYVSVPGLVDMVLWRGVQNGTAQVQYASCYSGVTDGCWYGGIHRMPFLSGPATNQHTAARLGQTNITVVVAVAPVPAADPSDLNSWTSRLVSATYDASQGLWAEWTTFGPLWPNTDPLFLDMRPQLSGDGSLVAFIRYLSDGTRTLLSSARSIDGTWSTPAIILSTLYSVDQFSIDRAPTGEALLMYNSEDTAFSLCAMNIAGVWTCLNEDSRLGIASLSVTWCSTGNFFVIAYADLKLNLAVETLNLDGSNDTVSMQLLPLGYVVSTLDAVDTPYGVAVAWSQDGQVNYALVASDGFMRHSAALAVNVSEETSLGGDVVKTLLSWNGAGLTAVGISTSAAGGSTQGTGYLYARDLPVAADAAVGMPQFSPADFSSIVTVAVAVGNLGLLPYNGAGVKVQFTLVATSGATAILGSVAAPTQLLSGELVNVTFSWTIATGSAGVLRVSLAGNNDANATNDVMTALPTFLKWDLEAFRLDTPGTVTSLLAPLKVVGPGAASVEIQLWSTSTDKSRSSADYIASVSLSIKSGLSHTVRFALSPAQMALIGGYVRLDTIWQNIIVQSVYTFIEEDSYDFSFDGFNTAELSIDHTHLRLGLPVLNKGIRTAKRVPVTASLVNDDGSIKLLSTMFVSSIPAGGNVSALLSFTVPVSGEVQIMFEVNPVTSGGDRIFTETWTHDNTYDRTYVTRSPTDGASWSSSVAGHGGPAFASVTGQKALGTGSAGWVAPNPVSQAAWGNNAASSGATESTGHAGNGGSSSSSAYSSSSHSFSSAGDSSTSNTKPSDSGYYPSSHKTGSGVQPSSDHSDSSGSYASSSGVAPQSQEILALIPFGGNPRIVLAGNPDTFLYAAVVTSDSVIARVDFEYAGAVLPTASHTAVSFLVALPAKLTGTNVLVATGYDVNGMELSSMSVSVPVLTLPPWVLALQPNTIYQRDGSWLVTATWRTTLSGGKFNALSGTSLVDVAVTFADTVLDLTLSVLSTGGATLSGNSTMAIKATQPSGAVTPAASLQVYVVGNVTMDDSHGFGNDVDLVLRSVTVVFGGQATLALSELLTSAPLIGPANASTSVPLAVPLSVSLSVAPQDASVTLTESDYNTFSFGGLPIALPQMALINPMSLGISVTVTAHSVTGVSLTKPCSATVPVRADASWSPSNGFLFGTTSAALTLACPVCVDAFSGRQCTDSAPLLSWSLLRAQPSMPTLLPWSLLGTNPGEALADDTVATRYRYRVTTSPASEIRIAQSDSCDLLVWTDVSTQLFYAIRPRAMPWQATPPSVIASQQPLMHPTIASLGRGAFLLIAVSPIGLLQATFNASALMWSTLTPVFATDLSIVDSQPELTSDGRLLFVRRYSPSLGFTQLLSAERNVMDWRVPKVVIFDASRIAAISTATSGLSVTEMAAMVAYQSYGQAAVSLCVLTRDTWVCKQTQRASSRPALVHNGRDFVLLTSGTGNLIADRLAADGGVLSSMSSPMHSDMSNTQAFDLQAVRSTLAGGNSVLAIYRRNVTDSRFDVALVTATGTLSITARYMFLTDKEEQGQLTSTALAWTASGLVVAAAVQEAGQSIVGAYVMPYTGRLAIRTLYVSPGPLAESAAVTVVITNDGAATLLESEDDSIPVVRLAVRDGVTALYTTVAELPLTGPLPSGVLVNLSTTVSSGSAALYGALTANVGDSSLRSLSVPLCSVTLQNATLVGVSSAVLARVLLGALGNCNMRVHLTAWSSLVVSEAPRLVGQVWIPLSQDFSETVSVQLSAAQHIGSYIELRISTEDQNEPFQTNTIFASTIVYISGAEFDFRIRGAGVDLMTDGKEVTASVPIQNFGSRYADNVSVEAYVQTAGSTIWELLDTTFVATGAFGGRTNALLTFTVSSAVTQVQFRVNGNGLYHENLWFDNVLERTVRITLPSTAAPATSPPRPTYAPHSVGGTKTPLSKAALVGVSIAGALIGALIGAIMYIIHRKCNAPAPRPRVNLGPTL